MSSDDQQFVLGALDTLGAALSEHDHQWSEGERAIYESAIEAVRMEAVPEGLFRCRQCGWAHEPDDICHQECAGNEGEEWKQ